MLLLRNIHLYCRAGLSIHLHVRGAEEVQLGFEPTSACRALLRGDIPLCPGGLRLTMVERMLLESFANRALGVFAEVLSSSGFGSDGQLAVKIDQDRLALLFEVSVPGNAKVEALSAAVRRITAEGRALVRASRIAGAGVLPMPKTECAELKETEQEAA